MLAVAILARYSFHLAGTWRRISVISAVIALYLNVFVLVVQPFLKVPALTVMAPTQTEPPFLVAQTIVMLIFVALTIFSTIKFRPDALRSA
jgi:hypothetical protein